MSVLLAAPTGTASELTHRGRCMACRKSKELNGTGNCLMCWRRLYGYKPPEERKVSDVHDRIVVAHAYSSVGGELDRKLHEDDKVAPSRRTPPGSRQFDPQAGRMTLSEIPDGNWRWIFIHQTGQTWFVNKSRRQPFRANVDYYPHRPYVPLSTWRPWVTVPWQVMRLEETVQRVKAIQQGEAGELRCLICLQIINRLPLLQIHDLQHCDTCRRAWEKINKPGWVDGFEAFVRKQRVRAMKQAAKRREADPREKIPDWELEILASWERANWPSGRMSLSRTNAKELDRLRYTGRDGKLQISHFPTSSKD
ncbi:MAG: hypothetical protein WBW80_11500 [Acidimicrobiales bacterium]